VAYKTQFWVAGLPQRYTPPAVGYRYHPKGDALLSNLKSVS